jgi:hypothetical protein
MGVRNEELIGSSVRETGHDACDVRSRAIGGKLDRMAPVPASAVGCDAGMHVRGATSVDRGDDRETGRSAAAEKITNEHADRLAKDVPAGDIDGFWRARGR